MHYNFFSHLANINNKNGLFIVSVKSKWKHASFYIEYYLHYIYRDCDYRAWNGLSSVPVNSFPYSLTTKRERNADPDPDPGGLKRAKMKKKRSKKPDN
jgi:hypothetical protein